MNPENYEAGKKLTEVWMELPFSVKGPDGKVYVPTLEKDGLDGATIASFARGEETLVYFRELSPADAVLALLAWVKGRKEKQNK